MKKDLKKRLEKALSTLKEPGGSTIRSIIKVINKDSPILSLRKVLEALQDGINEGFLCMYNGRFKLRQDIKCDRSAEENEERRIKNAIKMNDELKTSNSENEDSETKSDDDSEFELDEKYRLVLKKSLNKGVDKLKPKHSGSREKTSRAANKSKKAGIMSKKNKRKSKREEEKSYSRRYNLDLDKAEGDSIVNITPNMPEKKCTRPTAERPDVKKQRGPRCTSMKKDIRMPSKVHLPFVPPSTSQKSNTFNDLLRRSPEPLNGPLFDKFMLTSENFSLFGTYC